ncbi:MAG: hypothetical protein UU16_C0040G0009 [Candidatus Woesebacteria bacterium GW2011_GWA2_40_7]|uniref:Uncharacterized protein n=2 Tax=Candidatus Woeseibacteriota TaxID=1752722 RepID=A0A0G0LUE2_9BACT|nr:MAG: hypothetical protein UT17_C0005G0028 [Candidatus Woesebacteria bacterium GW2011_GWB1_39_10]KKR72421.1 MAG: hypothetical protein UU16_C0040G0009 [Candidatus Woesebacteria bacterium GW2011_GWA2_40_7]
MQERQVQFSEEEKTAIAETARDVARIGEDFVWEMVYAKVELMKLALKAVFNGIVIDNVYYTPTQIRHEVDVIGAVIDQARIILQVEGRDTMSELDRHTQEAGLGSVFDPGSEINSRLKDVYGR